MLALNNDPGILSMLTRPAASSVLSLAEGPWDIDVIIQNAVPDHEQPRDPGSH